MSFFDPLNNTKGIFGPNIDGKSIFESNYKRGAFLFLLHSLRTFLNQSIDGKSIFEPNYKRKTFLFLSHSLRTFFTLFPLNKTTFENIVIIICINLRNPIV